MDYEDELFRCKGCGNEFAFGKIHDCPGIPKPTLGVMPKKLFEEKRIEDLARAIYERSRNNFDDVIMTEWADELFSRLINYQNTFGNGRALRNEKL